MLVLLLRTVTSWLVAFVTTAAAVSPPVLRLCITVGLALGGRFGKRRLRRVRFQNRVLVITRCDWPVFGNQRFAVGFGFDG